MNAELTPDEVTARLHRAMDGATGLPPDDLDQIETLIRMGEPLLAFEALCTQIDAYDISLHPDLVQQLIQVGSAVGAEKRYSVLLKGTQGTWHRSATQPPGPGEAAGRPCCGRCPWRSWCSWSPFP